MIVTRRHHGLDDARFQALLRGHEKAYAAGKKINSKGHQGVSECEINGATYMIKCYRSRSLFSTIRLWLGVSRVDRSFSFAEKLNNEGISSAKHLLAAKHLALAGNRAYLIMEKAPGTSLFEFIQPDASLRLSETAIGNIASLITGMHRLGIAHGDLHSRNLIIADDDSVRLIDFDNARKSTGAIAKDLRRFRDAVAATSGYEPLITEAMRRLGHPLLAP